MIAPFVECPPDNIQVLLDNDSHFTLEGDSRTLSLDARISIIGCVKSPADALERVRMQTPDVIITGEYFYTSSDTGDFLTREVRAINELSFQPGIAVLTTMNSQHVTRNVIASDGDYCLSRDSDFDSDSANLLWLVHDLYRCAQKRAKGKIAELRGDTETQKRRWLRWAIRELIKDDGIFVDYLDDRHRRKEYFIELAALIVEHGGMASCNIGDAITEIAAKLNKSTKYVSRRVLSYVRAASSYTQRHRKELDCDNIFLMKGLSLCSIMEHYAAIFSSPALLQGVAATAPYSF